MAIILYKDGQPHRFPVEQLEEAKKEGYTLTPKGNKIPGRKASKPAKQEKED